MLPAFARHAELLGLNCYTLPVQYDAYNWHCLLNTKPMELHGKSAR